MGDFLVFWTCACAGLKNLCEMRVGHGTIPFVVSQQKVIEEAGEVALEAVKCRAAGLVRESAVC